MSRRLPRLLRTIFGPRRQRDILDEIREAEGRELTPELRDAIARVMETLTPELSRSRLRSLRPAIVLAFARQAADGARRLKSDYWRSDAGENVGQEVLRANGRALTAVKRVLATAPSKQRALPMILETLNALVDTQRSSPSDVDGYGLATLHELHRDIERLAPRAVRLDSKSDRSSRARPDRT